MKAMVQDTYGPTDVLAHTDVDVPVVGAGNVPMRVRAVALRRQPQLNSNMHLTFVPAWAITIQTIT